MCASLHIHWECGPQRPQAPPHRTRCSGRRFGLKPPSCAALSARTSVLQAYSRHTWHFLPHVAVPRRRVTSSKFRQPAASRKDRKEPHAAPRAANPSHPIVSRPADGRETCVRCAARVDAPWPFIVRRRPCPACVVPSARRKIVVAIRCCCCCLFILFRPLCSQKNVSRTRDGVGPL